MTKGNIAVIDIGKTNAKLALVRASDLSEIAVETRPNTVRPGPPYPHFDVEGHWAFLLDALRRFHTAHGIAAITVTTHGAAGAFLAKDGTLAAPILDYEHALPDAAIQDYDALRAPFEVTGSPRLPLGLNLGAQMFWQLESVPGLRDRMHRFVTYPQFWGHRLTGAWATDVTSLGCHTDLWCPRERRFSALPEALGLTGKIAAPLRPGEVLGTLLPEIAQHTGLSESTPVYCGIHDSNASLLPHLVGRAPPFSVVSTGTWVIAMTIGGAPVSLEPERDTLMNVNALGDAVPSARFMGGREHDLALEGHAPEATEADLRAVLTAGVMLLPSVVPTTGPFAGQTMRWVGTEPPLGTPGRSAAVAFYLALVTTRCLDLIGHEGPVIVEGPFARNLPYLRMLGVAAASPVVAMEGTTGTAQGAALLARPERHTPAADGAILPPSDPETTALMAAYAKAWRRRADGGLT